MKEDEENLIKVRDAHTNELLKTATQKANGKGGVKSLSVHANNAQETNSISASRAADTAHNDYKDAAAEAQGASGSIKDMHTKAHHLHKIAMERANMAGMTDEAMKHSAVAKKHEDALQACDYSM